MELSRASPFPPWLKKKSLPIGASLKVARVLKAYSLPTVCQSARCPNLLTCWSRGTATFLILGEVCTRTCRFCAVKHGKPGPVDPSEPERIARAAREMRLRHIVITSVSRDDLADGGAGAFAQTIKTVRQAIPEVIIEVLTPDFQGNEASIRTVVEARPDIFNHNIETVPRLYPTIRPQADYQRSLNLLRLVKQLPSRLPVVTKSGLLLGLGEEESEVIKVLEDLRAVDGDMVTLGQYLRPTRSPRNIEVARFIPPAEFERYQAIAYRLGFKSVSSGPFVRSSYGAAESFTFASLAGRANPL